MCAGQHSGRQADGSGQATETAFSQGGPVVGTQSSGQQPAANGGHGAAPQSQGLLPVGSSGLGDGSGGLSGMDFHMESLPSLGSFPRWGTAYHRA